MSLSHEHWTSLVAAHRYLSRRAQKGDRHARCILKHFPSPHRAAVMCGISSDHPMYTAYCRAEDARLRAMLEAKPRVSWWLRAWRRVKR